MSEELGQSRLERIVEVLRAHGVEFLVIGGQAEYLFGSPRYTADVDICYRRERANLDRLAAALKGLKARLRGVDENLPFLLDAKTLELGMNFTFVTEVGDFDTLGFVEPIGGYEKLLANREEYDLGGQIVQTIGLDDLLAVKLHIKRAKDQESIVQLKAIKRIREEGKQP
jgi:predicted nucleotidyltransferase